MASIYSTPAWAAARTAALERDGHRCTVSRLLGGKCSPTLHVHHLTPVEQGGDPFDVDNLLTVCASHHPVLEALRRSLLAARDRPVRRRRCTHRHPYPGGREECERRMARQAA